MDSYRWLTDLSQKFLEEDYLLPGQSVDDRVNIICSNAEKILKKDGFAKTFKENFQKGWYSLSTPIWANFGLNRGLPISCFSSFITDDMTSILYNVAEIGTMTKYGGGTSAYLGNIRNRGSMITDNGFSSGSVHFLQLYNTLISVISQGKLRRGSFAAYLPIDHGDIEEFLTIKHEGSPIQDIFTGVCITDNWMQSMIDGDRKKRKIWAKVLESRANIGIPYIFFTDNVNRNKPDVYKDKNYHIYSSNLCCVAGDQLAKTREGFFTVKELYEDGRDLTLFDGEKYVLSSSMRLVSENEDVYKLTLSNDFSHTITKCHKVKTKRGLIRLDKLTEQDEVAFASWDESIKYSGIKKIEYIGKEPVYCPEVYSDEHVWLCNGIITSNSEILLPLKSDESFVCDLSSMNILYYDEWKNTNAVELMVYFLDAVMTEFIEKAKNIPFMERPVRFAERHRALGIGWIGWHSYLQSKMIPWESMEAKYENTKIIKTIKEQAYKASEKAAKEYGEPELLKGYGRRNTTLLSIAPTKSSSFIIGQVSESIEPQTSNYCIKELAKGKFSIKNPYLERLLEEKGKNTNSIWKSILKNGGSVQHLEFLTNHEKDVFKTFSEISPKEIIIQAAQRQQYLDQGQSLNLMIHPDIPTKDVNALIIEAWRLGITCLYYQKSVNAAQKFSRELLSCVNCEA